MSKTLLLTGATDGIGLETAIQLAKQGHHLLLTGRSPQKLTNVRQDLLAYTTSNKIETYTADLSTLNEVVSLAQVIKAKHQQLDVIINNAGVYKTPNPLTIDGLDSRFVVNAIAPYLLSQQLLPLLNETGRIINLSSAAQAPVNIAVLKGQETTSTDMEAYAQSKLAITMWTRAMATAFSHTQLVIIAVNPGSLLGSKMVKEGFGIEGKSLSIGADILIELSLSSNDQAISGQYFDNDSGQFANPHPDALDQKKCLQVTLAIEEVLQALI